MNYCLMGNFVLICHLQQVYYLQRARWNGTWSEGLREKLVCSEKNHFNCNR